jgi:hypothetical protein
MRSYRNDGKAVMAQTAFAFWGAKTPDDGGRLAPWWRNLRLLILGYYHLTVALDRGS